MIKQVIVVRKDLNMRCGKIASQCAHATMKSILDRMNMYYENGMYKMSFIHYLNDPMSIWLKGKFTKIIVGIDSLDELLVLEKLAKEERIQTTLILDSAATDFGGEKTVTCIAFGPDNIVKLNKITGHLKLL